MVVGGDLMRAVGSLAPSKVKHNFCDNVWDTIVRDFDALAPLKDVFVEHRHPHHGLAKEDATYKRGSSDYIKDEVIYRNWLSGKDRMDMNERVAKLFGKTVATVKTEDINLVIGVPMQDETVDIAFHSSINRTITSFGELGIKLNVLQTSGGSHIGKARERVLWEAMAFNPTHIMFIDADMGWEPNQITRLLCADHEFSAVAGVKKVDELKICANFLEQQNLHDKSKFLEVRDVGFAFVMLKRSVIEKMCAAYPELAYNAGKDKTEFALFLDMIDDRERLSEDFSFCRRWRAMGGKIWLDADQGIIHAGRKQYTGKVSDLFTYEKKAEAA
jgi:hypothetical protein